MSDKPSLKLPSFSGLTYEEFKAWGIIVTETCLATSQLRLVANHCGNLFEPSRFPAQKPPTSYQEPPPPYPTGSAGAGEALSPSEQYAHQLAHADWLSKKTAADRELTQFVKQNQSLFNLLVMALTEPARSKLRTEAAMDPLIHKAQVDLGTNMDGLKYLELLKMAYCPRSQHDLENAQDRIVTRLAAIRQAPGQSIQLHAANFCKVLNELKLLENGEEIAACSLSKLTKIWRDSLDSHKYAMYINEFDKARTSGFPKETDIFTLINQGILEGDRIEKLTAAGANVRAPRDTVVATASDSRPSVSSASSRPSKPAVARLPSRPRSRDHPRGPSSSPHIRRDSHNRAGPKSRALKDPVECAYHRDVLGKPGMPHHEHECEAKKRTLTGKHHQVSAVICTVVHDQQSCPSVGNSSSPAIDPVMSPPDNVPPLLRTDSDHIDDHVISVPSSDALDSSADASITPSVPMDLAVVEASVVATPVESAAFPGTLTKALKKRVRAYNDPDLADPLFLAELAKPEAERNPSALAMLVQKILQNPPADDPSYPVHPGCFHAFSYLRVHYSAAAFVRFIRADSFELPIAKRFKAPLAHADTQANVGSKSNKRNAPSSYLPLSTVIALRTTVPRTAALRRAHVLSLHDTPVIGRSHRRPPATLSSHSPTAAHTSRTVRLILDSGATISVVNNSHLLRNTSLGDPVVIHGIGPTPATTAQLHGTLVGLHVPAIFLASSKFNVVSYSSLTPTHRILYDSASDRFDVVTPQGVLYYFTRLDNLYIHEFTISSPSKVRGVPTTTVVDTHPDGHADPKTALFLQYHWPLLP